MLSVNHSLHSLTNRPRQINLCQYNGYTTQQQNINILSPRLGNRTAKAAYGTSYVSFREVCRPQINPSTTSFQAAPYLNLIASVQNSYAEPPRHLHQNSLQELPGSCLASPRHIVTVQQMPGQPMNLQRKISPPPKSGRGASKLPPPFFGDKPLAKLALPNLNPTPVDMKMEIMVSRRDTIPSHLATSVLLEDNRECLYKMEEIDLNRPILDLPPGTSRPKEPKRSETACFRAKIPILLHQVQKENRNEKPSQPPMKPIISGFESLASVATGRSKSRSKQPRFNAIRKSNQNSLCVLPPQIDVTGAISPKKRAGGSISPRFSARSNICGAHYEGDILNGKYHGKGKMVYPNGEEYEGNWVFGHKHGYGVLHSSNGEVKYEGEWEMDKYHGEGSLFNDTPMLAKGRTPTFKLGFDYKDFDLLGNNWAKFQGEFKQGVKHGIGTIFMPFKEKFIGEFRDGKANGRGTFTRYTGDIIIGEWAENKLIELL